MNQRIRLHRIENPPLTLHFSPGYDVHARTLGSMVDGAYRWLSEWLGVEMAFTLSVLRRENWELMRRVPYGYPHSNASRMTIYVPARYPPRLMNQLTAMVESAEPALQQPIREGFPTLETAICHFLDLVAVHELGHLFSAALHLELGAGWLAEFVADLFATAYFAEGSPADLPVWLAWAQLQTAQNVPHRTVAEYDAPPKPLEFRNANFYQGQFNLWAYEVWQREGKAIAPRLIREFSHRPDILKERLSRVMGGVTWL
jgi:hypothetical protein